MNIDPLIKIAPAKKIEQGKDLGLNSVDAFSAIFDEELAKTNLELSQKGQKEEEDNTLALPNNLPNPFLNTLFNDLALNQSNKPKIEHIDNESTHSVNELEQNNNGEVFDEASQLPPDWRAAAQMAAQKLLIKFQNANGTLDLKALKDFLAVNKVENVARVPTDQIYAEMLKQVKFNGTKPGRLKLGLEPENLGKIDIYFVLDEQKKLHVSIAAQAETKKILTDTKDQLQQLLQGSGYELADLSFASQQSRDHQSFEQNFASGSQKSDYNMLNILDKKDIISQVNILLSDILVNYVV